MLGFSGLAVVVKDPVRVFLLLLSFAVLAAGCTSYYIPPQPPGSGGKGPATTAPGTVHIAGTASGPVLVDAAGRTLYYYARDTPGSNASACTESCIAVFPAFFAGTLTVFPPLDASEFSSFTRADGQKQLAYRGRPLYYRQQDSSAGEMTGNSFEAVWFAAGVSGTLPITPSPVPPAFPTLSPYGGGQAD